MPRERPPASAASRSPAAPPPSTSSSRAGLIDELRLHVAPLVVGLDGRGIVRLFDGVERSEWDVASARSTPHVSHVTYRRR